MLPADKKQMQLAALKTKKCRYILCLCRALSRDPRVQTAYTHRIRLLCEPLGGERGSTRAYLFDNDHTTRFTNLVTGVWCSIVQNRQEMSCVSEDVPRFRTPESCDWHVLSGHKKSRKNKKVQPPEGTPCYFSTNTYLCFERALHACTTNWSLQIQ